ncbi:histidinol phosphatase [Kosmotoga arenicorallina S304]|uniref:Histidinol phosphatase n=1 Tax=Kosmotoga arenicorallina S304 TaxID=1453497 RepID=A0A182C8N2_9BACT|nr:PHP domain-containing protein [Kosmotoga arenicorallina]OAA31916.1 histidinol phosphatase [Kosmotoga arenicorallina S304]
MLRDFYVDFHIHSCLSPCAEITMTPAVIGKRLQEIGIDWISITDHNSAGNVRTFSKVLKSLGIEVIPGIEVHTVEDVHILGFFESIEAAEAYSSWLYKFIPDVKVDPEKFGYQLYVNEDDEFTAMEEKWLGQPTSLKLNKAIDSILEFGGIYVYSHIERKMGIVYQLGFVPGAKNNSEIVEISQKNTFDKFNDLQHMSVIHSSDAHSPQELKKVMRLKAKRRNFSEFKECLLNQKRVELLWD